MAHQQLPQTTTCTGQHHQHHPASSTTTTTTTTTTETSGWLCMNYGVGPVTEPAAVAASHTTLLGHRTYWGQAPGFRWIHWVADARVVSIIRRHFYGSRDDTSTHSSHIDKLGLISGISLMITSMKLTNLCPI